MDNGGTNTVAHIVFDVLCMDFRPEKASPRLYLVVDAPEVTMVNVLSITVRLVNENICQWKVGYFSISQRIVIFPREGIYAVELVAMAESPNLIAPLLQIHPIPVHFLPS